MQVVLMALKDGVSLHLEDYIKIAGPAAVHAGLPLLREAELRAVVDARRNVHLELALALQIAFALTFLARTANDLAAPAALVASSAHRKKRLLINHFALAAANGASSESVFGLGALAGAAAALFQARNLNVDRDATHGVFEIDLQVVADIVAALRARAALLTSAAGASEDVAESENVTEDVGQVGEARRRIETVAGRCGHAFMAEAIVGGALLGVAQDAVSLGGFLEFLFRVVVAGIAIGMIFQRQLAVGGLEYSLLAIASDAENFVIIALGYAH